jgi:alpha-mannosidase
MIAKELNPLAGRLGLSKDDLKREGKLERLLDDLRQHVYRKVPGTIDWHFREEALPAAEALHEDWENWPKFDQHSVWGRKQDHTWFAARVMVPQEADGKPFVLRFTSQWSYVPGTTDPQCLCYVDGQVAQAIDGHHTEVTLSHQAKAGTEYVVMVNAFTFNDTALVGFEVEYLIRNKAVEALVHDLDAPLQTAKRLPQSDSRRHTILSYLTEAFQALDRYSDGVDLPKSMAAAQAIIDALYALPDHADKPLVTAIGHTHLDVAWLWRVKHTRDKTARSMATVLALMDEFPDYIFMYNQPVLFDFLRKDYPEIWEGIKARVSEGRFEIEGAMWVEPDVNIASGEALVRQMIFGIRFHQEEFGITPRCLWLPDTFGYSAALPQLMKLAGLDTFITSKTSWNDTNRMPYDTFWWDGIDGSAVRTQLITTQKFENAPDRVETTYTSDLSVSDVMGAWRRYEPKRISREIPICYGHGDGGGGPTRDMIQTGMRLQRGILGAPAVRMEGIGPYLERLETRMTEGAIDFPRWSGELYLEYHRGTLTSVANNKRNNRKAEIALREVETLWTMAALDGAEYPYARLRQVWKLVLLNQFHDILPGTSIHEANVDANDDYAQAFALLDDLLEEALAHLAQGPTVFNITGQDRGGEIAEVAGFADGQTIHLADGTTSAIAKIADAPATGAAALICENAPAGLLEVATDRLENDLILVRFDIRGEITSVYDKSRNRELLPAGGIANQLIAFEDKPMNWDAWDIDAYYEEFPWPLSDHPCKIDVVETGPLRAALRIERSFRDSKLVQIISLTAGEPQVEFDTFVDWNERQTVLKVAFPMDLNTRDMRSEIQFGHVRRPTHRNTSWDEARFEASMHRWIDMSEPDFGAALLNDCKYGYDAHDQTLRLTLLCGPVHPDPVADIGEHRFRYALRLHKGHSDVSSIVAAAERFNVPLRLAQGTGIKPSNLIETDAKNVCIETIKMAEDGNGAIVRLYETANQRTTTKLTFGRKVTSCIRTDLLENPLPEGDVRDGVLSLQPFEILTLRVKFKEISDV